jgi:DNA-binding transcriptional LysR family regulator
MKYTLRQLEVFLAVAHFENITRAAQSLAMSQSAASGSLKELESQFDIQLFDRIGKRLQLNELGAQLRPLAESLLTQALELESKLAQHSDGGDIRLGATLTIGNYLAVGLMAAYMQHYPGSRVGLHVGNTQDIVRQVTNFDVDIGLIEGELQHPDLELIHWQQDELVVFCSPQHPLVLKHAASHGEILSCDGVARIELRDEDLLASTWIVREPGSGTRQAFERGMHGLLPKLNVMLELEHTEAIKRAVEANLGISCLSSVALKDAFERGSLIPLAVPGRDLTRSFYVVLHRQKYRSAGIEQWLALCGL